MKQLTDIEFEEVINKYKKLLFKIAYYYTHDVYSSEEVVQETFVKLYELRNTFKDDEHIKRWLIRVTINKSLNTLRRNKKELLVDNEYIDSLPDLKESEKDEKEIFKCVCSLKESYRTVIILRYYENYNIKEIANILKISESNVATRLDRARKKLKTIIERRKE